MCHQHTSMIWYSQEPKGQRTDTDQSNGRDEAIENLTRCSFRGRSTQSLPSFEFVHVCVVDQHLWQLSSIY